MRTPSAGQARLRADIHRLLSTLMQREIADPRLQDVTITRVESAAGGKLLILWVHGPDGIDHRDCIQRLNRLLPHFSRELRQALPKRRLPDLEFRWDDSVDDGDRVLHLLRSLERHA